MRSFVIRTGAVVAVLGTALLVNSFLQGALPFLGLAALLPLAVMVTGRMLRVSMVRVRRKRRAAARMAAAGRVQLQRATVRPALRVVAKGGRPDGPRVA